MVCSCSSFHCKLDLVAERALELWKSYDELFDNLSAWTEDKERKVKQHAELQKSLEDKQNLLRKQKDLHEEVTNGFLSFARGHRCGNLVFRLCVETLHSNNTRNTSADCVVFWPDFCKQITLV